MIVPNAGGRDTDDVLRTLYTLDVMSNGGLGTVIVAQHTGIYIQFIPSSST
jgi:hypothetical protein